VSPGAVPAPRAATAAAATPAAATPAAATRGATRGVAVLGSTGSIGTTALRVLDRQRGAFRVEALTAYANAALLAEQVRQFCPAYVGLVVDGNSHPPAWETGPGCLIAAATHEHVDIVLNAVVGAAGLDATLAALRAGKRVALANKETLVVAGELVGAAARAGGGEVVPVDSEHSAILQCLGRRPATDVRRLLLTASGGPFRGWSREQLEQATIAEALSHPTWRMGRKISVDSATLANKALEVIEAHFLFGVPYDQIEVVVHPQSVVHSFVEFIDGSVLAQLGVPRMDLPVLYALTHPERLVDDGVAPFDPVAASPLTFERVRTEDFPAFALGLAAGKTGGAAPAVFNAANEQAVGLFLEGRMSFAGIPSAIGSALDTLAGLPAHDRSALLDADAAARAFVRRLVGDDGAATAGGRAGC
jgi:1-deoxy-D-xylulose-5-phosphate reductoisomerase